MSWLLFLDESGHDHRTMPYEVRGGVAIHAAKIWPFVQAMQEEEMRCFGARLGAYRKELKGCTLLDRKRFRFAEQAQWMSDSDRQKYCRAFLKNGREGKTPRREEFTAYGQACLKMAEGIMGLLHKYEAVLFAAAIPALVPKPPTREAEEYLRKDHVFLFERFFYFLDSKWEHGLLVVDEVEKTLDRAFMTRLQRYFTKTRTGRERTTWIVPTPFFVSSDMTYPLQAADVCIYCLNWGFRVPSIGMDSPKCEKIAAKFGRLLNDLQFCGQVHRGEQAFTSFGIVYVSNPYTGSNRNMS